MRLFLIQFPVLSAPPSYRRVIAIHNPPASTINNPDAQNQHSTPAASLTGPAISSPKGVASVMAVVSMEKTFPIISGATVSCIYAISGTLKNVPDAPMKKQQTTKPQNPPAGRMPPAAAASPSTIIDSEIIKTSSWSLPTRRLKRTRQEARRKKQIQQRHYAMRRRRNVPEPATETESQGAYTECWKK